MADTKLSAMTELDELPADTDEFYINDGGTSKKIQAHKLGVRYRGALIDKSADSTTLDLTTAAVVIFDQKAYDTEADATTQRNRIWLGADAAVTFTNATDNINLTAHGMITGDGPFELSTSDTLPAELAASTDYWFIKTDANSGKLATSLVNALAATAIAITDDGTGTHTIVRQSRLVVPSGITAVRLSGAFNITSIDASKWISQNIKKNGNSGATYAGGPFVRTEISATSTINGSVVNSAILQVAGGDYFEYFVGVEGDTSLTMEAEGTWFGMEIIQ